MSKRASRSQRPVAARGRVAAAHRPAAGTGPANPTWQRLALGRRAGGKSSRGTPAAASRTDGAPIPGGLRGPFESSLGADLSRVRVHTGPRADEACREQGAAAFAFGNDIHFARDAYRPETPAGRYLLAHEVVHARQQALSTVTPEVRRAGREPAGSTVGGEAPVEREADRAAASMIAGRPARVGPSSLAIARKTTGEMIDWWSALDETEWDPRYARKGGPPQKHFETGRRSGTLAAASAHEASGSKRKGTPVGTTITQDQLRRIISAGEKAAAERIAPMAGQISRAFETMLIDTAQAQAGYLAHMAGETGGNLVEAGGSKRSYAPFHGRGAVQVTGAENYAVALGYLQQRADQLERLLEGRSDRIAGHMRARDAATQASERQAAIASIEALRAANARDRSQLLELQEAINAIRADPAKAADERYAFLLSAAHMHRSGGVARAAELGKTASFTGKGAEDKWVTGGNAGMTFAARERQNLDELAVWRKHQAAGTLPPGVATAEDRDRGIQARDRLVKDMQSAQSRGAIKARVYAKAMSVLVAENGLVYPD